MILKTSLDLSMSTATMKPSVYLFMRHRWRGVKHLSCIKARSTLFWIMEIMPTWDVATTINPNPSCDLLMSHWSVSVVSDINFNPYTYQKCFMDRDSARGFALSKAVEGSRFQRLCELEEIFLNLSIASRLEDDHDPKYLEVDCDEDIPVLVPDWRLWPAF